MVSDQKKIPKLEQFKITVLTSFRVLKVTWSISPFLLMSNVVAFLLPAILPFVNIYIYKLIIDFVVQAVARHQTDFQQIFFLLGIRIATFYLQELSFRVQEYVNRVLWLRVPIVLSELILGKLATLDIRYFEDSQSRELLKNVEDTYNHRRVLNLLDFLMNSLQSLVQLLIAAVAIAIVHWFLIVIILIATALEFIHQLTKAESEWGIWWSHSADRVKYDYLSWLLQDASSMKEIKVFQLGSHFVKEIVRVQEKFLEQTKKAAQKNLVVESGLGILSTFVSVGVEVFVISRALVGQLTIGDIGFYSGVISSFQNGLAGLLRNVGSVFESSLYAKSVFELLDAQPFVKAAPNPVSFTISVAPTIEFRDVSFTYPGGKQPLLQHFSLTIHPGEKIAFVGENGAGKSTIIKLLARFYDVDEGAILINGLDIKELDLASWHQHVGILFQDFNQYQYTARENIAFGDISDSSVNSKVEAAAVSSGAASVIEKLSHQYEQVLGKTFDEGVELSTGQWQKIALARSFFRNAPVLVLDEPTAAIDAKAEAEIFASVEQLSKDKSVIIISHRFSTVRNADTIYVIDDGSILEHGSHAELMAKKGKYAQLFALQAKGYQ